VNCTPVFFWFFLLPFLLSFRPFSPLGVGQLSVGGVGGAFVGGGVLSAAYFLSAYFLSAAYFLSLAAAKAEAKADFAATAERGDLGCSDKKRGRPLMRTVIPSCICQSQGQHI
jgi:hypothetical protein